MQHHHPRLTLLSSEPPASDADLAALLGRFALLPPGYVDWAMRLTEQELLIDGTQCLRIWSPAGCIEMSEAHPFDRYLPSPVPIGDDGGGHAVVWFDGASGPGLYLVSFGDIDPACAVFLSTDLHELLTHGVGLDLIA